MFLDVKANELALVYRARGMSAEEANSRATEVLGDVSTGGAQLEGADVDRHEAVGTGIRAAVSSFSFFASGALIPVLPYLFGLQGAIAVAVAAALVGIARFGRGTG